MCRQSTTRTSCTIQLTHGQKAVILVEGNIVQPGHRGLALGKAAGSDMFQTAMNERRQVERVFRSRMFKSFERRRIFAWSEWYEVVQVIAPVTFTFT